MKLTQLSLLILVAAVLLFWHFGRSLWFPYYTQITGGRTVDEVIQTLGVAAADRVKADFKAAGVVYPPDRISLIAIKDSNLLELWSHHQSDNKKIRSYPIQAASGILGPKLREGDRQVPEGIYQINAFNPNSAYHLSMKLNYPNAFDLKQAGIEGRSEPGSNIFIHGKAVSIGCLAMGDTVIEELFTLVHAVGRPQVKVIISPSDPDIQPLKAPANSPHWVSTLYQNITAAVKQARQSAGS